MIANAIPTPSQIAASIEAVDEITGLVYRLQRLIEADESEGRNGLMVEVGPLLLNHIGCLAGMAGEFLNGYDNRDNTLREWMLPTGVFTALEGGAA